MTSRHRSPPRSESIDVLLGGLVDYAGLFPPASESMRAAAEKYADYRDGADQRALGRFIVPASRLAELERESADLMPRRKPSEPWRLSALIGGEPAAEMRAIVEFNQRHSAGSGNSLAAIDVVEIKGGSAADIAAHSRALPKSVVAYFEIPAGANPSQLIGAVAAAGARAKIRTGGVTADAFPSAEAIIAFIDACLRADVAFKATAGLHHPLRGEYRLTYEPGSATAMMYGYLNVFLATALLRAGSSRDVAQAVLLETDPASLDFEDDGISWRGRKLTTPQLLTSREFAISFGSCSFREPIDELGQLTRTSRTGQL